MAEGKKSFVLYADLIHTVKHLSKEDAGELFMHILRYVNDENPESETPIVKVSFEPVKQQLKRDLIKWEKQLSQRRQAGKKSAEVRATKSNERSTVVNGRQRNLTDNVTVSVNVNEREYNNSHLAHEDVCKHTIENEAFIEQSAMILQTTLPEFKKHLTTRLAEMKLTGQSSKYPLGTVKNILIQDFKLIRESEKRGIKPILGGTYKSKAV